MNDELQLQEVKKAAEVIKNGGVVVFPTDTVYGVGCKYDDKEAVEKIYDLKGTEKSQQFPILVADKSQVGEVAKINKEAEKLIEKYWPGGLTIIVPLSHPDPAKPENDLKTLKIGLRMPNSDLTKELIRQVGSPIIGTSANFHGNPAPRSFEDLDPEFIKLVDYIVKGECKNKVESTVIDTTVEPPKILRQGVVVVDLKI